MNDVSPGWANGAALFVTWLKNIQNACPTTHIGISGGLNEQELIQGEAAIGLNQRGWW